MSRIRSSTFSDPSFRIVDAGRRAAKIEDSTRTTHYSLKHDHRNTSY
jgi:hypothetical protein